MATINVKIYKAISGAYKDKYIAIADALNQSLNSPIELVAANTYKVNLPDFNNINTNGIVESILELQHDSVTVEQEFPFTSKSGLELTGNLFLYQNTNMILVSNDLTTSKVDVVYYGYLATNIFNGSKYVIYTCGDAEDVYTIS